MYMYCRNWIVSTCAHGSIAELYVLIFEDALTMQSFSSPTQFPDVSVMRDDSLASYKVSELGKQATLSIIYNIIHSNHSY